MGYLYERILINEYIFFTKKLEIFDFVDGNALYSFDRNEFAKVSVGQIGAGDVGGLGQKQKREGSEKRHGFKCFVI